MTALIPFRRDVINGRPGRTDVCWGCGESIPEGQGVVLPRDYAGHGSPYGMYHRPECQPEHVRV